MKRRRVSQLSGGNNEMLGLTGFTAELNGGGLLPLDIMTSGRVG
jgi:hypothetical protein